MPCSQARVELVRRRPIMRLDSSCLPPPRRKHSCTPPASSFVRRVALMVPGNSEGPGAPFELKPGGNAHQPSRSAASSSSHVLRARAKPACYVQVEREMKERGSLADEASHVTPRSIRARIRDEKGATWPNPPSDGARRRLTSGPSGPLPLHHRPPA